MVCSISKDSQPNAWWLKRTPKRTLKRFKACSQKAKHISQNCWEHSRKLVLGTALHTVCVKVYTALEIIAAHFYTVWQPTHVFPCIFSVCFQSENHAANIYYLLKSCLSGSTGNMCQGESEVSFQRAKKIHVFPPGVLPSCLFLPLQHLETSDLLNDTVVEGQVINCLSVCYYMYAQCCYRRTD